ncbi:MAG: putative DNA binding domain-containing protein [Muribaculaceae bacterium]
MINNEMTERDLQKYLKERFPKEDTSCDWKEMKNLKNSFANDPHKDVVSYLSGISNMEGGHLVIGVVDGTLDIVGTDLSKVGFDKTSVIHKMLEQCTNLPEDGLYVEEFITTDTNKVVWVINIPKHLPRRPVIAHKKMYQRRNDSLIVMTREREEAILHEDLGHYDWSAEVIPDATISDLDEEAIKVAIDGYCDRYPKRAKEAKTWTVEKFLDKAKITKNGKITRTALLLLGKEESVHYLNHPAEIVWKLQTGEERAANIFYPPFLLSAVELRGTIRNYQIKIFPSNALLPTPVMKYDQRSLLEGLHNCILHQDYTRGERIIVTESADCVIFQNAGTFYEGKYEDYVDGKKTPTQYRNPFLQNAMVNLNMIDSQGFGIHDMFENQRSRFLPMPDYDKSTDKHVIMVMPGQVINEEYSTALMENTSLDLTTVFLLDRVQRNKPISKDARAKLRDLNLIEGRHPHIIISRKIAQITHQEAEYTSLKGFDDQFCKDLILKSLREHIRLKRTQINELLLKRLPDILDERQKNNHIDYLLKQLRKNGKIHVGANKYWELGPDQQSTGKED